MQTFLKWLLSLVFGAWILSAAGGCLGAPQYPNDAENSVRVKKSLNGVEFDLMNKADTDVSIDEARYNTATNDVLLRGFTAKSQQSKNQEMLSQWMMMYQGQQAQYNEQMRIHGQNVIGGINAIGQIVTPLGQSYLQNRAQFNQNATQIALGKQQMIDGLAAGIIGGNWTRNEVASTYSTEVLEAVNARLAAIEAEVHRMRTPASQPSE